MKFRKPGQALLILLSICTFAIVFITDITTPLGYAHWLFYVFPLLIIYLSENSAATYFVLALSAVALVLGLLYSSAPVTYENMRAISAFNRIAGFIVLLLFTVIINKMIQTKKHYQFVSDELSFANKELESFSYSAAHDLKAPLRAIKGFSDIIMEDYGDTLDRGAQDLLERIINSSEKMAKLIDDMLNLSKVASMQINFQEVDLSRIAHSVIDDLKAKEPRRKVEVRINEGIEARADAVLMKIVLTNLLGNAWKFSSKKEISEICFGCKNINGSLVFFVKDNGSGFDMANASQIFEPFRRLHSDKEFSGTGIGLSIVNRIIIRHGGKIWAEAEVDKGAVFYFTLPRES